MSLKWRRCSDPCLDSKQQPSFGQSWNLQAVSGYSRLGELMLAKGLLTQQQLEEAAELRCLSKLRFGEVLVRHGFASDAVVAACLAEQFDIPVVDPMRLKPTNDALALLPHAVAQKKLLLPVDVTPESLAVVVADPIDLELTDQMTKGVIRRIMMAIAAPTALRQAID